MGTISAIRQEQGLTLSELGERLGVSPSAVYQLEKSEDEGTVKLNTLLEAHRALGSELRLTAAPKAAMIPAPHEVARELEKLISRKESSASILRALTQAVEQFASENSGMSSESLNFRPTKISHPGWDTLFKALVKKSLGEKAPRWANPSRLAKPWFLSEYETLRKKSISTTPADLKNLNIYVDAASIKRA